MIKLFNIRIMTNAELAKVVQETYKLAHTEEKPTLNCGYKSCNFTTTDPKGLKIHRSRVHRHK